MADGCRILLVEDIEVNRTVVAGLLRRIGHTVTEAAGGRQAIEALSAGLLDVVLMDCEMPGMDGYEATRRIRGGEAGEANRRIPIVALTGYSQPSDRRRCLEAGMTEHLAKPFSRTDLERTLAEVVVPADPPGIDGSALADLRALGQGPDSVYVDVLATFRASLGRDLDGIASAIDGGDREQARATCRALAGAADQVGAIAVAEGARLLAVALASGDSAAIQQARGVLQAGALSTRTWLDGTLREG